jgi:hypothetical protein
MLEFAAERGRVHIVATVFSVLVSVLVGGTVATVTVISLVSSSVDTTASTPGNVDNPVVSYGSNN